MGGLVVDFGDRTIDLSVQSRVTKLNQALQGMHPSTQPSHTYSLFCRGRLRGCLGSGAVDHAYLQNGILTMSCIRLWAIIRLAEFEPSGLVDQSDRRLRVKMLAGM